MKLEQAARQALEALEVYGEHAKDCPQYPTYTRPQDYPKCDCGFEEAIAALREALAEQAEQEAVAWAYFDADGSFMDALDKQHGAYQTPLYAAPVRTKDLTDDEIAKVLDSLPMTATHEEIIRAVIAADREKNCGTA